MYIYTKGQCNEYSKFWRQSDLYAYSFFKLFPLLIIRAILGQVYEYEKNYIIIKLYKTNAVCLHGVLSYTVLTYERMGVLDQKGISYKDLQHNSLFKYPLSKVHVLMLEPFHYMIRTMTHRTRLKGSVISRYHLTVLPSATLITVSFTDQE